MERLRFVSLPRLRDIFATTSLAALKRDLHKYCRYIAKGDHHHTYVLKGSDEDKAENGEPVDEEFDEVELG
jgi:hypothetical protein